MQKVKFIVITITLNFLIYSCNTQKQKESETQESEPIALNTYEDLVALFNEWRTFERPPFNEGAPDYTKATFEKRWPEFKALQNKLNAIDTTNWAIEHKVDWYVVWAEMNGYDFNHRILKPWERDPAFYASVWTAKSDVPAHEGPTHHAVTELWTYNFPLSTDERLRLLNDLKVIPPLNEQAKQNLTGNAKDLWITGIRDIRTQSIDLKSILDKPNVKDDTELVDAIENAISSTDNLV